MNKISTLLTLGFLLFQSADAHVDQTIGYDNKNIYDCDDDEDDAFSFDTNDLNTISHFDNIDTSHSQTRSGDSASQIWAFFSFVDNPSALLNIPIYQQTSSIRNRPILEYPFTLTYGFDNKDDSSISLIPFLNYSTKKNYTKTGTALDSYFLLANPIRFAELQKVEDQFGLHNAEKLAESLGLFDPATVEERRLGGVIEAHVLHNNWNLMMQLPILYVERNLFLTPAQKALISISSLGGMLATDGVSENDFVYKHIVMDQVGLGDFKFKAMYEIHATNTFDIDLGGFIIVPTATPFAQGLAGIWFDANNERGYLDLTTIDPTNITSENQDQIANFFLDAVDKLSSNILNCPLGNNGHVVFAPSINFDWYFAQNWQFSNDFSLQVPLPAQEQRFYQYTQTQSQFLTEYNAAHAAGASNPDIFANYVNTQIQNLFFPFVFPTMIYPGVVFNSTNQLVYHLKTTDIYFGSNFWYQGAEQMKLLANANNNNQNFSYDYQGVTCASAAQEKLFAKINYNVDTTNFYEWITNYSWSLSLYGDITVWNSGIGNDFTLGLCVDCKF